MSKKPNTPPVGTIDGIEPVSDTTTETIEPAIGSGTTETIEQSGPDVRLLEKRIAELEREREELLAASRFATAKEEAVLGAQTPIKWKVTVEGVCSWVVEAVDRFGAWDEFRRQVGLRSTSKQPSIETVDSDAPLGRA